MVTLTKRNLIYAQDSHQSLNYWLIESQKDNFYPEKYDEDDKDWKRLRSRRLYDPVFHATNTHTGFISQASIEARIKYDLNPKFYESGKNEGKKKPYQPCHDHHRTPQILLHYLAKRKRHVFNKTQEDFKEFLYYFKLGTSVIEVTKEENKKLSSFTSFTDNNYKVYQPSDKKYEKANIILCERPAGVTEWKQAKPTDKIIEFTQDFLDFEKEFLV
jgi:hypothetical protein